MGAHPFHVGIELQRPAKRGERGGAVAQLQVTTADAAGGAEMIRVDLQCLVAIANRGGKAPQAEQRKRPLIPTFGQPGSFVDQPGRLFDRQLKAPRRIVPNCGRQGLSLGFAADAAPYDADAIFGQHAHSSVGVAKRGPSISFES